jgi:hypothetical protein
MGSEQGPAKAERRTPTRRKGLIEETPIVKILQKVEGGRTAKDVCRENAISKK